jgi:hypothetical protein
MRNDIKIYLIIFSALALSVRRFVAKIKSHIATAEPEEKRLSALIFC